MNATRPYASNFVQRLSREKLFLILNAALESSSFRFARQTALAWLTNYPGDLGVSLILARALMAEGRLPQAVPVLERLCRLDPEFEDAYAALLKPGSASPASAKQAANAYRVVKSSPSSGETSLPAWLEMLRAARTALASNQVDEAEKLVAQVLAEQPDVALAGILHTQVARARGDAMTVVNLASIYHTRWPDCLQIALLLAEAQLESGDEASAVTLLHHCVVNDAAGQVAERLWGANFAYRPLWPDPMEIAFDIAVPADVARKLGWNLLPAGPVTDPKGDRIIDPMRRCEVPDEIFASRQRVELPSESEPVLPFIEELLTREEQRSEEAEPGLAEEAADLSAFKAELPVRPVAEERLQPLLMPKYPQRALNETLIAVQDEFERVAKRLKTPGIGRADGRFPVYVIFSTERGLDKQYGANTRGVIDLEMQRLATQIARRAGWDALVFYPDNPSCMAKYGLKALDTSDPWKLKLALVDLDHALAKKGKMIGALLIVGGADVVPFHHLPNPTDDMDSLISSDNPYATVDANYFVQDWPVGRLPGEAGPDAGLLLEQLRQITRTHTRQGAASSPDFWKRLRAFLRGRSERGNFGYTAAVWQRSSLAVFRPIGEAHTLLASPPQSSGSLQRGKLNNTSLGYYNLHGLADAAEWYGQRDITDPTPGPDYPVAITPRDISGKSHTPQIVFSEACYGAYIEGKTTEQSMALKFLAQGTQALIGSSAVAYGSVSLPLIGADLLGHLFWKHLKAGSIAGEAFMQAKVDLVREMNKRQGFLDGEDQKTLLSFVFYGDPLTGVEQASQHKAALRPRIHPAIKTICDRQEEGRPSVPISGEVLKQVKAVVSEYLPGLESADLRVHHQYDGCDGKGHNCPTSHMGAKAAKNGDNGRTVVTIHKEVKVGPHTHQQYARVTLDKKGNLAKLAMSR